MKFECLKSLLALAVGALLAVSNHPLLLLGFFLLLLLLWD